MIASVRAHLGQEAEAGFPHLKRIPFTKTIQFLDYFASLHAADRADLLDALALRGEAHFFPGRDRLFPSPPAFERYWTAMTSPGPFVGGYRYVDVKSLIMIPKVPEFGGYDGWIKSSGAFGLALQPRADLLPNMDCLKPARAPLLRKLADAALKQRGFIREKALPGGEQKYVLSSGVVVRLDFASRFLGQLRYAVSVLSAEIKAVGLSYESFWGQPGGWDYLTEENAPRSIDLLPEVIAHLIRLVDGVNERAKA